MLAWSLFRNYLLSVRAGAVIRTVARLSILGIGIGVASLIVVLSVMGGFNKTIRDRLFTTNPHLTVILDKNTLSNTSEKEKLAQILGGEAVSIESYDTQDIVLRTLDGTFGGAVAKGMSAEALKSALERLAEDELNDIPKSAVELGVEEVILGVDLARTMNIAEGDEVLMIPPEALLMPKGEVPKFQKVVVKELVSTRSPEADLKLLWFNSALSARGFLKGSASQERGYEIRLRRPYDSEMWKARLEEKKYRVESWRDRNMALFFALKMESLAMTLFLSIAVIITSFSIVTVMVLLMTQKRKDIGMLMAMGLSKIRTQTIFTQVGLFLAFLGIGGGFLLGLGIAIFMKLYPISVLPSDVYYDSTLPSNPTASLLIWILLGSSVLAVFGVLLPVRLASRMAPAEAIRSRRPF